MRIILLNTAILFAIVFNSCLPDHSEKYLKQADFDHTTSTLAVNYKKNPDTTLQQIIMLSGIRKEGYGVLLNINKGASPALLDSIKNKFNKQDINAVHSFKWKSRETLPENIRVAIEDARFCWVFSTTDVNDKDSTFQLLWKAIETSRNKNGILVINSNKTSAN